MFTRERVRDLDIFDRWTTRLIDLLSAEPGRTVDVCDLFYRMTLDVTTDFLLGHDVGALDNPDGVFTRTFTEVQHMQIILTLLQCVAARRRHPPFPQHFSPPHSPLVPRDEAVDAP